MTTENLEGQKKEIAQTYIEQLQTELGGLKGSVLSLFKNRIESLLIRSDDLPEDLFAMDDLPRHERIGLKITMRVGSFVSPESMDRVVNFIKEKHTELQSATTTNELNTLARQIKNPGKPLPPENGVGPSEESSSTGTEGKSSTADNHQGDDPTNSTTSGGETSEGSNDETKKQQSDNTENPSLSNEDNTTAKATDEKKDKGEQGSSDAIVKGVETGVASVGVAEVGRRTANTIVTNKEIKSLTSSAEITKTRNSLNTMRHHLSIQLSADHLSLTQKNNIQTTMKKIEEGITSIDDGSLDGLQARKKLGMTNLGSGILDGLATHPQYKQINKLLSDNVFLDSIAKADSDDAVKTLFKTQGIENIDALAGVLRNSDDIANMSLVLRHAQGIKAFKAASYAGVYFEAASIGVDIWMYYDAMEQAKTIEQINAIRAEIMKEQARFNLGVGIATSLVSLGIEIGLLLAASGPPGWIGLAIGVAIGGLTYCFTESADALYFEKKNFYYQNQEELKNQIMPQLWRSTISAIHGITTGDIADRESGWNTFLDIFASFSLGGIVPCIIEQTCGIPSPSDIVANKLNADVSQNQRNKFMCDTIASTLFLQHFDPSSYPTIATYMYQNPEQKKAQALFKKDGELAKYEEEMSRINAIIAMKMEYIKDFLPSSQDDPKGKKFIDPSGSGVKYLMQLYHQGDIYYDMHTQEASCYGEDVNTYESELLGDCLQKEPAMIQKIEAIKGKDPYYYRQILAGLEQYVSIHKGSRVTNTLKNRGGVLETYIRLYKLGQNYTQIQKQHGGPETTNYKLLEDFFIAPEKVDLNKCSILTQKSVYDMIRSASIDKEHSSHNQLSTNTFQNFLWLLATTVYKKDIPNTWSGIVSFYNGANRNHLAIAYDTNSRFSYNGGFIGQKGGRDLEIDPNDFQTKTIEQITEETIDRIGIDTAAENADNIIDGYIRNEMKRILGYLLEYKKPQKIEEVSHNVINYIKTHGQIGSYIRLPDNLRDEMLLSGLGNPSDYFFSLDNQGNIIALTGASNMIIPLKIPNIRHQEIPPNTVDILSMRNTKNKLSYRDLSTSVYTSFIGLLNAGKNTFNITTTHQQYIREMSEEYDDIWNSYQSANTETQKVYYISRIKELGKRMLGHSIGLCVEGANNSTGNANVNSPDELNNILSYEQSIFEGDTGYILNAKLKDYAPGYEKVIQNYKTSNGQSIKQLCESDDPMREEYGRMCALWVMYRISLHTLGYKQSNSKSLHAHYKYPNLKSYADVFPLTQEAFTQWMPPIDMRYNAIDTTAYIDQEDKERENIEIKTIQLEDITIASTIDAMVQSIQASDPDTLNESRMAVIYDRESSSLQGYGYKTDINTIEKVLGSTLSLTDKVWGTHLINYFKWYKSQHPDAQLSDASWLGAYPGIYNGSTKVLSQAKIESLYPFIINSDNDIQQSFINYINTSL